MGAVEGVYNGVPFKYYPPIIHYLSLAIPSRSVIHAPQFRIHSIPKLDVQISGLKRPITTATLAVLTSAAVGSVPLASVYLLLPHAPPARLSQTGASARDVKRSIFVETERIFGKRREWGTSARRLLLSVVRKATMTAD
jgi:hypothetical protein